MNVADVRTGLDRVHARVADAGGDPAAVTVLAVTKGFGPEAVAAARAVGLTDVGENYAQELTAKHASARSDGADPSGLRWHFIGRLQSNKVRQLADLVDCWQSVDRPSLVREIARRAPGARVMVQVNATAEEHKGGAPPAEVPDLVGRAVDAGLDVVGLMGVGRDGDDDATRAAFARIAGIADDLGLHHRSMGMSGDLELAVEAGTTMIRVGTALFGARPPAGGAR